MNDIWLLYAARLAIWLLRLPGNLWPGRASQMKSQNWNANNVLATVDKPRQINCSGEGVKSVGGVGVRGQCGALWHSDLDWVQFQLQPAPSERLSGKQISIAVCESANAAGVIAVSQQGAGVECKGVRGYHGGAIEAAGCRWHFTSRTSRAVAHQMALIVLDDDAMPSHMAFSYCILRFAAQIAAG